MQAQVLLRTYHRYLLVLPAQAGNAVQHRLSYSLIQGLTLKGVSPSANKERLPSRKSLPIILLLRAWHVLTYWASVTAYTRCTGENSKK